MLGEIELVRCWCYIKVVKALAEKKVKMVPFNLSYSVPSAQFVLNVTMDVETLAHFDHWQRARQDAKYEDQTAWPVELRRARLISAVDYIQVRNSGTLGFVEFLEKLNSQHLQPERDYLHQLLCALTKNRKTTFKKHDKYSLCREIPVLISGVL